MPSRIINRILAQTGMPRLVTALADELGASDLQSLLLTVYQARARDVREAEVLARAGQHTLLAPSTVDARLLNRFDRIAFDCARDFEAVDLSPVCPLGTNFVLGLIDQNNVLTTIRNAEVLGDSTPALALECARRRKPQSQRVAAQPVRLASSHRVIRLQPFDFPGYSPHFRLFGLVSAGRDTGSQEFEMQHLNEHVRVYLDLFRALNREGFQASTPLVEFADMRITEALLESAGVSREHVRAAVRAHAPGSGERFLHERGVSLPADVADTEAHPSLALLKRRVVEPLEAGYPEAEIRINLARLEGLGYYTGFCLRISPMAPDGVRYPVADGGFTDWTARLLEDKKERLLISGIGSEFVCRRYWQ
jgi:hypothetical protein